MVVIRDVALLIAPQNLKKGFLSCIVVVGRLFILSCGLFFFFKQTVFAVSKW